MTDSLRRAIRTFCQAFIGSLIMSGILSGIAENGVVDWSGLKKLAISAAFAGIVALLTFAQNALEDTTQFPALLKAPPSPGENPVPVPEPVHETKPKAKKTTARKKVK